MSNVRFPTRQRADNLLALTKGHQQKAIALQRMGFNGFRPRQEEVVNRIMACRDVLCILATGGGKTACFIIPSLCMGWATVIFSPLQALMKDQVNKLQALGIPAARVTADQSDTLNDMALDLWMRQELQFLYVSPERIDNPRFKHAMAVRPLEHMVVDEAHCLHQWSQTFRPAYRHLGDFAREMDPQVISAFTATCPEEVMADIQLVLGMANAEVLEFYSRRNNLNLSSSDYPGDNDFIQWVISLEGSCIVYCSSQKKTEKYSAMADEAIRARVYRDASGRVAPAPPGYNDPGQVTYYHADVPTAAKAYNMAQFMSGKARIIFATNAFGMGIDKGDIRHVVHRDIPGTPEALSQEIGRAGRDEQPSWCHLFFDKRSVGTQEWFIDKASPPEETVRHVHDTLKRICDGRDNGVASLTNMELAIACGYAGAGGYADKEASDHISAVLTLLSAHRIIEKHEEKDTTAYVQFVEDLVSVTPMFVQHRDAIYQIGVQADDRIAFDIADLAEIMRVEVKTLQGRLRQWANGAGYIKYWSPAKSRPIKIVGDIETLPWEEVRNRRESSYAKLHDVIRYHHTPDHLKQQVLEEMMGYRTR